MAAVLAASPFRSVEIVDFFREVDALHTLGLLHVVEQYELCLNLLSYRTGDDMDRVAWLKAVRHTARRYLIADEAFRSLAKEYGYAVERLYGSLISPALGCIQSSRMVKVLADTTDECEIVDDLPSLPSVEEKRREYQEVLQELISNINPRPF